MPWRQFHGTRTKPLGSKDLEGEFHRVDRVPAGGGETAISVSHLRLVLPSRPAIIEPEGAKPQPATEPQQPATGQLSAVTAAALATKPAVEAQPSVAVAKPAAATTSAATRVPPQHSSAWVTLLCFLLALIAARMVIPYLVEEMRYAWHRGELRAAYEVSGDGLRNVSLDTITQAYQMVVDRTGPSVVHIDIMGPVDGLSQHGDLLSAGGLPPKQVPCDQGSGIVVSEDGFVLTNEHVIKDGEAIRVTLSDGRRLPATIIGIDALTDLALLKIDANGLLPITWGDSDAVRVGMPVWAMGSPFGLERTVTSGILSGKHRAAKAGTSYQDFMQSDAAVNPGNSGGPLVDSRGELIGVNTAIVGDTYRGVSFSIPSNVAKEVFERLRASGKVARGWLGVALADSDEDSEQQGAVVTSFAARVSPAREAGIKSGDLITAVNGTAVHDMGELMRRIAVIPAGTKVILDVLRDGSAQSIEVTIGARPEVQ